MTARRPGAVRALRRRVTGAAAALTAGALLALTGCSASAGSGGKQADQPPGMVTGSGKVPAVPYDVRPLIRPAKKYFGAALDQAPHSLAPVTAYTAMVGKQPNLLEYYAEWGAGFDASGVRRAWQQGSLTLMSWEPFHITLANIAAGKGDTYLKQYATAVRTLNLPVVVDFADEFNGNWDIWGTKHVTPAQYVAAWRHIHDVFVDVGAGNVIWAWSPNIVNPVPGVDLKPYYPGDGYVDWVGMVGYFTLGSDNAFASVFGPTMKEVRTFTRKPFIIIETASEPGQRRRADVRNLFAGVAARDDVLGFIWFNYRKKADWRLQVSPLALAEFKKLAADDRFGFDVRKPA
ncbi:glycoside hydrolase family 26 protein [Streptomyces sp. NBC_01190]|uniref:glycoside hydrolase family 26 protein n=1 Tax=Streptomyces sp. NBC_01190 TaxID=2903767 RepID=UPI00386E06E3|nr:glycosyl hydrolase [Streptomyces sp. NBC_01190]